MKLFDKIKAAAIAKFPNLGITEGMSESEFHQALEDAPTPEDTASLRADNEALETRIETLETEIASLKKTNLSKDQISKLIDEKIKAGAVDLSDYVKKDDLSAAKPEDGEDTRLSVVTDLEALQSTVADIKAGKVISEKTTTKGTATVETDVLEDFETRHKKLMEKNAAERNSQDKK